MPKSTMKNTPNVIIVTIKLKLIFLNEVKTKCSKCRLTTITELTFGSTE